MFRHITLPLVVPFMMVAVIIRTIDALKSFDTIYVITQGGPGTASETINIYLYLRPSPTTTSATPRPSWWCSSSSSSRSSLMLLCLRQRTQWTEIRAGA